jgi:hypothetical protein
VDSHPVKDLPGGLKLDSTDSILALTTFLIGGELPLERLRILAPADVRLGGEPVWGDVF